jgi:ribonuclease BN (tRNA processing enzyme)
VCMVSMADESLINHLKGDHISQLRGLIKFLFMYDYVQTSAATDRSRPLS